MKITKRKIISKLNEFVCFFIRNIQPQIKLDGKNGYLTIFHDYEGVYARPNKKKASYYGVTKMLDIEKKYNIKTTYNIVGKLADDVPEIIGRIINEGHDIASHSYKHDFMTDMTRKEIDTDIKATVDMFKKFDLQINGIRSPQNRWNFKQMNLMVKNGMGWSAEGDSNDFPYFIIPGRLLRFPVKNADHRQYAKNLFPEQVNQSFMEEIDKIIKNKCYGAIGFHPWVQGEHKERLEAYDCFLNQISTMSNLKIKTFGEMHKFIVND